MNVKEQKKESLSLKSFCEFHGDDDQQMELNGYTLLKRQINQKIIGKEKVKGKPKRKRGQLTEKSGKEPKKKYCSNTNFAN